MTIPFSSLTFKIAGDIFCLGDKIIEKRLRSLAGKDWQTDSNLYGNIQFVFVDDDQPLISFWLEISCDVEKELMCMYLNRTKLIELKLAAQAMVDLMDANSNIDESKPKEKTHDRDEAKTEV